MALLRLRRSRFGARAEIAFALAVILLAATAPVFFFTPVVADSVPALSLDICHPLPSIGSPSPITLASAPAQWSCPAPALQNFFPPTRNRIVPRLCDTPDTPPPKLPA